MRLDMDRRQFLTAAGLAAASLGVPAMQARAQAALQNVSVRGQLMNGMAAAKGAKSRIKAVNRFLIASGGAQSVAPVFANFSLVNAAQREVDGEAPYTIVKAAIAYGGRTVPLSFVGQRSVTIAPGAVKVIADPVPASSFGQTAFAPDTAVFVRMLVDLPARGRIAVHANPAYLEGESQLLFDPRGGFDDIDGTGWTIPPDAENWVACPVPVMLLGAPVWPVTSVAGVGDSILDGSVDNAGDGSNGGGWGRRAAFSARLPYLSVTRTGDKAQFVAGDHAKSLELVRLAGARAAVIALGNNDLRDGRGAEDFLRDCTAIRQALRQAGVAHIAQARLMRETVSKDANTSLEGQHPHPAFARGGPVDAVNAALDGLRGGDLDDVIDVPSAVQTQDRWIVPLFETRLVAPAGAWSGTLVLDDAPEAGDHLAFLPAQAQGPDLTWSHVMAVSGDGPFKAVLNGGPGGDYPAGSALHASFSADGIHPQAAAHRRIALIAQGTFQRMRALAEPAPQGMVIDFPASLAWSGGKRVPLDGVLSVTSRASSLVSDGLIWRTVAPGKPRLADGGCLMVEAASRNHLRNAAMVGAGPGRLPEHWRIEGGEGLSFTVKRSGVENGLAFIDLVWSGTPESEAARLLLDEAVEIAPSEAARWSLSAFLAVGRRHRGLSVGLGIDIIGQGGAVLGLHQAPIVPGRDLARFAVSAEIREAGAKALRPMLVMTFAKGRATEGLLRIALPQLENREEPTSPIPTTGAAATRPDDMVSLQLPAGRQRVSLVFDDGSTQVIAGASGTLDLAGRIDRPAIRRMAVTSD